MMSHKCRQLLLCICTLGAQVALYATWIEGCSVWCEFGGHRFRRYKLYTKIEEIRIKGVCYSATWMGSR